MLKLIEYLNNNDIFMEIGPSRLRYKLPRVVDVVFSHGDNHTRFLVDIEAIEASGMTLEDALLERGREFLSRVQSFRVITKKENL